MAIQKAKFSIGDIVKHKHFEFRGVIYDVDLNLIILKNGINLFQRMFVLEKISLFIIYLLKMMKLLMKLMFQSKTY